MKQPVRNDAFDPRKGFSRGRPLWFEAAWYFCKVVFFLSAVPWPSRFKVALLRFFGATVGAEVVIKPRVNIHLPWKLKVGDHAWIGEEVYLLNLEAIVIGSHACISQRAFLCTGNHDYRDPAFSYRNAPIGIGEGAWVGAAVFVGPGVTVGDAAVAVAGSVVVRDLSPGMICRGNPCVPFKARFDSGSV